MNNNEFNELVYGHTFESPYVYMLKQLLSVRELLGDLYP